MKLPHYASSLLISPVAVLMGQAVLAQQVPSAGNQLLQIPAPPSPQTRNPELQMESGRREPAASADTAAVVVNGIQFQGSRSIAEDELIRVSGFVPGQSYTLGGLRALASSVSAHYRSLGYFLAQAYLHAQDVTDGVVRFTVVEGQYGQIQLRNRSGLSDAVADRLLNGLRDPPAVSQAALERRLLVLSDLPGVQVKSILTPGTAFGTTDLLVDIQPGQAVSGSVEADNQGNTYTGANRIGASISLQEPTGRGDVATVRVLTSGDGLNYGRASYQALVGWVNVGLAYTTLQYRLGGDFAATQSSGTARIASLYANYPVIRSRAHNLNAQWLLDQKEFSDRSEVGATANGSDKSAHVGSIGLRGDFRDAAGNGSGAYSLTWTHGSVSLRDPVARLIDTATAQSQGTFDKLTYAWNRQLAIRAGTDLVVGVNGQWASKNLDASEKFSLGGPAGVRAYPSGEATGDEGVLLTLETRTGAPFLQAYLPGQWQWIGFVDAGITSLNKNPWDTVTSTSRRTLAGAGVGLAYAGADNWMFRVHYAFKLGGEIATSAPDAPGRFWLQINKTF